MTIAGQYAYPRGSTARRVGVAAATMPTATAPLTGRPAAPTATPGRSARLLELTRKTTDAVRPW